MGAQVFFMIFFEEFGGRSTVRSNDFYDFFKEICGRSTGRPNEFYDFKSFGVDLLGAQMIFMIFLNELQHVYWAVNIMRIYKSHNHETFKEQISMILK